MNCPMHNLIFKSRQRSYRELPLRLFEFGTVYRYEKSGEVHGLTRVRGLTQDDSHIYCTREQMKDELTSLLNNNAVSFRFRDGSQLNGVPVDEAREKILAVIKKRAQVNSADDFAAALA